MIFHQGAELGPRPEVKRGKPLDDWDQFLDPEGRVTDPQRVKELVFRGVCLCFTDLFLILLACHKPMEFPLNKNISAFCRALFHLCGRRYGSSYWGSTHGTAQATRERISLGSKRKLNMFCCFFCLKPQRCRNLDMHTYCICSLNPVWAICSCCGFLCPFSLVFSWSL